MIVTDLLGKRLRLEKPLGKDGFAKDGGVVRAVYLDPNNPQRGPMVTLEDDEGHFYTKTLCEMRSIKLENSVV